MYSHFWHFISVGVASAQFFDPILDWFGNIINYFIFIIWNSVTMWECCCCRCCCYCIFIWKWFNRLIHLVLFVCLASCLRILLPRSKRLMKFTYGNMAIITAFSMFWLFSTMLSVDPAKDQSMHTIKFIQ